MRLLFLSGEEAGIWQVMGVSENSFEMSPQSKRCVEYFRKYQETLCNQVEELDGKGRFLTDSWERQGGGGGTSRVMEKGALLEKAGVNFSLVHGHGLPPSATAHRPDLAGGSFTATGVSLVFHPDNPYVPTTHLNVRYFEAQPKGGGAPLWWFGGGFDLTPYYPFREDAVAWHQAARDAAGPHYAKFKTWCDEYFFLKHRGETRGIGGLFFDDFSEGGFDASFALTRNIAEAFFPAYEMIVSRRRETGFGEREKAFQRLRRGRYVEFNLVYDRGTLFGLQSGGRTESILMSLPPEVEWHYDRHPEPGSPEEKLLRDFLKPQDWLKEREA